MCYCITLWFVMDVGIITSEGMNVVKVESGRGLPYPSFIHGLCALKGVYTRRVDMMKSVPSCISKQTISKFRSRQGRVREEDDGDIGPVILLEDTFVNF